MESYILCLLRLADYKNRLEATQLEFGRQVLNAVLPHENSSDIIQIIKKCLGTNIIDQLVFRILCA